jgi:FMN reductase (NADPH)
MDKLTSPTLDLIHQHGSCRRYKPDPLPDSVIETVVAAGQCASTSSNFQAYSVVAVTSAEKRQRLSELCGEQRHIREAPVFLAWCADLARLDKVCAQRGYTQNTENLENFLVATTDTVIAAQNAVLAAESLGLGACYIGAIRNNPAEVIDLLGLPKLTFPITGMTLGWPAREPRTRPRLPFSAILSRDHYCPTSDEDLRTYDDVMAETGIYNNRQVPVDGQPDEIDDYSWTEHTARRVSQSLRPHLREIVEKQGFLLK